MVIKKFSPATISEGKIIFVLGRRNTGKSVLMKNLLYHMPRPDYAMAMAPTEDTLREFREFLPEACIFDHFAQEKLDKLVTVQRELVSQGKKRTVLIILDDCIYEKGVLKSTAMRYIFFNGRHDHISLICTAQYMMDISCDVRANIDYIMTMRETNRNNRDKLYKYYFGHFEKFSEFDKVMTACTQDYKCLVLDCTLSTTAPHEAVFWYKSSRDVPAFKLCREVYWRWSKKYRLSPEDVRRAKTSQIEAEAASVRVNSRNAKKAFVVQTTDENGNIV